MPSPRSRKDDGAGDLKTGPNQSRKWNNPLQWMAGVVLIWTASTLTFFLAAASSPSLPPIAHGALLNLLTLYLPVFSLVVCLLLFLTRKRGAIDWRHNFSLDQMTAVKESVMVFGYLLITQLLLGVWGHAGLHFPGPDMYDPLLHDLRGVAIWVALYVATYIAMPVAWLSYRSFDWLGLLNSLRWKRDLWIIGVYWALDFFGPIVFGAPFFGLDPWLYALGIPGGIVVNTLGAGLPVVILMHIILIPRLTVIFNSKFTVIAIAGLFYAIFSLFDPGVDYSNGQQALLSVAYIVMTQTLVGMGKAAFTVVTGNPFIHFITLHVLSARVPLDTAMYGEIFSGQ
ncbi:MAG: hypothetical protein P8Q31_09825 [Luminiphilus sp.]|nr:hypothetical protein [Luminiphilus sp.]